jgi:hypothetical protein
MFILVVVRKGYDGTCGKSKTLVNGYAMYSDEFMLDRRLSDDVIAEIYRREIMTVTKEKTYMGIWQMHSFSSVLKMTVLSIYPEHGNPDVRAHLNRMVYPRDGRSDLKANIVWTTTVFPFVTVMVSRRYISAITSSESRLSSIHSSEYMA